VSQIENKNLTQINKKETNNKLPPQHLNYTLSQSDSNPRSDNQTSIDGPGQVQ